MWSSGWGLGFCDAAVIPYEHVRLCLYTSCRAVARSAFACCQLRDYEHDLAQPESLNRQFVQIWGDCVNSKRTLVVCQEADATCMIILYGT